MEKQGLTVSLYDQVTEDPPESCVQDLIKFARRHAVDGVVGVGGGSSMDAAKLAAFMVGDTSQELEDVYGVGLTRGRRLPLIQVTNKLSFGPGSWTQQFLYLKNMIQPRRSFFKCFFNA